MRTRRRKLLRTHKEQAGNISVVTIGFLVVVGLLIVVVVNASAAFLAQRQLANLADSIALGAADVVDEDYYLSPISDARMQIDEDAARSEAHRRLDPETALVLTVLEDEVVVRLERSVDLWLVPGMRTHTRVVAESRAQITVLNPAAVTP